MTITLMMSISEVVTGDTAATDDVGIPISYRDRQPSLNPLSITHFAANVFSALIVK